jgi:cell division protein FtsB
MAIKQKPKPKPKTFLSPLQRKRLLRISFSIVIVLVLWLVFAPGRGMFYLYQQKRHLTVLEAEKKQMIQENKEMALAIERLQNDKEYLEQVAREEHGMLKDNEIVFDFAKEKKKKK